MACSLLVVRSTMNNDRWCIILAAGEGSRLQPVTRALYGHPLPKQFASLTGEKTLLQTTVDRLAPFVPPARMVVVVAEEWEDLARRQLAGEPEIEVVAQPSNLGTGPGLLLPLARVRARARATAQIVVTPSDHYYARPTALHAVLGSAADVASVRPTQLVLVGATPDRSCCGLGWIVPESSPVVGDARAVERFVEKPPVDVAARLAASGALWNTFAMVGSLEAFQGHAAAHLPRQALLLDRYATAIGRAREREVLRAAYQEMQPADFSRSVLESARDLLVVPLAGSGWCDWGTPESLFQSLKDTPHLEVLRRRMHLRSGSPDPLDRAIRVGEAAP